MLIGWIKMLPRYRECASSGKSSPVSSRDGMRRLMRDEKPDLSPGEKRQDRKWSLTRMAAVDRVLLRAQA